MTTWSHHELGLFRFDSYCWTRDFMLPAFKRFKYRFGGRNVGRSKVAIRFSAHDVDELPSGKAITVAKKVIKNEELLARKVLKALFDDFHGKGFNSGMWWHGGIKSIHEDLSNETGKLRSLKIIKPDDLAALLGSPSVMIRDRGYGYDYPLATLSFAALFEIEHGLGVLTDGIKIVGTGYEMDVSPFK